MSQDHPQNNQKTHPLLVNNPDIHPQNNQSNIKRTTQIIPKKGVYPLTKKPPINFQQSTPQQEIITPQQDATFDFSQNTQEELQDDSLQSTEAYPTTTGFQTGPMNPVLVRGDTIFHQYTSYTEPALVRKHNLIFKGNVKQPDTTPKMKGPMNFSGEQTPPDIFTPQIIRLQEIAFTLLNHLRKKNVPITQIQPLETAIKRIQNIIDFDIGIIIEYQTHFTVNSRCDMAYINFSNQQSARIMEVLVKLEEFNQTTSFI